MFSRRTPAPGAENRLTRALGAHPRPVLDLTATNPTAASLPVDPVRKARQAEDVVEFPVVFRSVCRTVCRRVVHAMTSRVLGRIGVQLLDVRVLVPGDRVEATRALRVDLHPGGPGDEHSLHHRLQPQVEVDVAAFGHPGQP